MIHKNIQRIVLFSLLVSFSAPVHAFWGRDALSSWAKSLTTYVADVKEHPAEHKTALIVGGVCTLGLGVLAWGVWNWWNPGQPAPLPAEPGSESEGEELPEEATPADDQPAITPDPNPSSQTSTSDTSISSSTTNQPTNGIGILSALAAGVAGVAVLPSPTVDPSAQSTGQSRPSGSAEASDSDAALPIDQDSSSQDQASQVVQSRLQQENGASAQTDARTQQQAIQSNPNVEDVPTHALPIAQGPSAQEQAAQAEQQAVPQPDSSVPQDQVIHQVQTHPGKKRKSPETQELSKAKKQSKKEDTQRQLALQLQAEEDQRNKIKAAIAQREAEEKAAYDTALVKHQEEQQRSAREQAERERDIVANQLLNQIKSDFQHVIGRAPDFNELFKLLDAYGSDAYAKLLNEYQTVDAAKLLTGKRVGHDNLHNVIPRGAQVLIIRKAQEKRLQILKEQEEERQREQDIERSMTPKELETSLRIKGAMQARIPRLDAESSSNDSSPEPISSRSPSPGVEALSPEAEQYMLFLGQDPKSWQVEHDIAQKKNSLPEGMRQSFQALAPEVQKEIIHSLRIVLNDGQALPAEKGSAGILQGILNWWAGEKNIEQAEHFEQCYLAVREQAYLAVSMGELELKHRMTPGKKAAIGTMLEEAFVEAQAGTDFMGLSASQIKVMGESRAKDPLKEVMKGLAQAPTYIGCSPIEVKDNRTLHFMVRVLKPQGAVSDTGKVALFVPIHGTFADSGNYGAGTNNYDNGPRLMAAAQRMADAKGVTLHVIIPNWYSRFIEDGREEAACYILPLIQKWYEMHRGREIECIDLLGHSEGNSVITLILKGMADAGLKKHIRWLSVCPTAGSDYIPEGCKARVSIWSPADALAIFASWTRFTAYRKQTGLNTYVDNLFMNISLSYNGKPENHVTAKYRACALYDEIFDIAQRFEGHCELSMDVNSDYNEVLVAIRRGKESCSRQLDPVRRELLERVSTLAEERYRALYPNNPDWHEKPHDNVSFALRYLKNHGLQEAADGDREDAAITAAGLTPSSDQAGHYREAQQKSVGRIQYGWDLDTFVDCIPLWREYFNSCGVKNPQDRDKVLVGDFVHSAFARAQFFAQNDVHALDKIDLENSPHRKELIAALISYWDLLGSKPAGAPDVFKAEGDETGALYQLFTRHNGANEAGKSCVELKRGTPVMQPNYQIDLHGLPRDKDHVVVTPIDHDSFLVKLGKHATTTQGIWSGAAQGAALLMNMARGNSPPKEPSDISPVDSAIERARKIDIKGLPSLLEDVRDRDMVREHLMKRRVIRQIAYAGPASSSSQMPYSSSSVQFYQP